MDLELTEEDDFVSVCIGIKEIPLKNFLKKE